MKSIIDYPFYKLKTPGDRQSLIKSIRIMARYWEKLTSRNMDMDLVRLNTETVPQLKKHFKWHVSKEAAEIWLKWKSPSSIQKHRRPSSKKRSSKKRTRTRHSSKNRE